MFADPFVLRLPDDEWSRELGGFDLIIVAIKQVGLDFEVLEGLEDVRVERWCA